MKTLMGARLNDMRPYEREGYTFAQAALRWVLSSPRVDALIISMTSAELIDEYVAASGNPDMRGEHLQLLERYAYLQHARYCRPGCNFCEDACPEQVQIAEVLRTRMYDVDYGDPALALEDYAKLGCRSERLPDLRPRGMPGRLPLRHSDPRVHARCRDPARLTGLRWDDHPGRSGACPGDRFPRPFPDRARGLDDHDQVSVPGRLCSWRRCSCNTHTSIGTSGGSFISGLPGRCCAGSHIPTRSRSACRCAEIAIIVTKLALFLADPEWTIWTTNWFINKLFVLACFCLLLPTLVLQRRRGHRHALAPTLLRKRMLRFPQSTPGGLSILGCGLWLAACAGAFSDVEPPEVSLAGLAFDQPGLFEQRLRLDLRLRNPNDFALDVERVLFDLEVNDHQLGKAWTTEGFDVPALGEAVVPVTMIVPTSDLIERIMDFSMTQRLDYRLKGEAKLSNAAFGTVPFDQDGSFALPKLPSPARPGT